MSTSLCIVGVATRNLPEDMLFSYTEGEVFHDPRVVPIPKPLPVPVRSTPELDLPSELEELLRNGAVKISVLRAMGIGIEEDIIATFETDGSIPASVIRAELRTDLYTPASIEADFRMAKYEVGSVRPRNILYAPYEVAEMLDKEKEVEFERWRWRRVDKRWFSKWEDRRYTRTPLDPKVVVRNTVESYLEGLQQRVGHWIDPLELFPKLPHGPRAQELRHGGRYAVRGYTVDGTSQHLLVFKPRNNMSELAVGLAELEYVPDPKIISLAKIQYRGSLYALNS